VLFVTLFFFPAEKMALRLQADHRASDDTGVLEHIQVSVTTNPPDLLFHFHHFHESDGVTPLATPLSDTRPAYFDSSIIHHCGRWHRQSGLPYTVVHCLCGKHRIDMQKAIGHDLAGAEVCFQFTEPCPKSPLEDPNPWWHMESGTIVGTAPSSLRSCLTKTCIVL
jgi:hypothetical protein